VGIDPHRPEPAEILNFWPWEKAAKVMQLKIIVRSIFFKIGLLDKIPHIASTQLYGGDRLI